MFLKSILNLNYNKLKHEKTVVVSRKIIIDPEIYNLGLKGIYLTIKGVRNKESDPRFDKRRKEMIEDAFKYVRSIPDIKDEPEIQGFQSFSRMIIPPAICMASGLSMGG
jgi:DNA/RNA-binding domain of Phe-tRNA-synthetase-like protein